MGGHLMIIALAFVLSFFFYLKTDKFSPLPPSPIVKGNHTIKSVLSQISFPRHFSLSELHPNLVPLLSMESVHSSLLSAPRALFFLDQFSALMSHNTVSTRYFYDLQFALFSHPCSLLLRKIIFWGKKKLSDINIKSDSESFFIVSYCYSKYGFFFFFGRGPIFFNCRYIYSTLIFVVVECTVRQL